MARAIGAYYHVWKWHNVQRARSEMCRCTTHALYRSKLWQQDHCQQPQNANTDGSTCPRWWKQRFRLRLWSLVWFQVRTTSCHLTEVNSKVYPDVLKSVVIPWCNQVPMADPGCGSRTRHQPTNPKRPRLCFRRSATTLDPSLTGPPPSPIWTHWTTSFGHTSRISPTRPSTTPKPARSPPSADYSPSSLQRLWKRHAPSSGSVSRRWYIYKMFIVLTSSLGELMEDQTWQNY